MESEMSTRRSWGKWLAQLWGLAFVFSVFGIGSFNLLVKGLGYLIEFDFETSLSYGIMLVLGFAKGEFLLRRSFVARVVARAQDALGETGAYLLDYVLAPFCMLSLYRPWLTKHAIISWVLIPIMIGLTTIFARDDIVTGFKTGGYWFRGETIRGGVDFGIGFALGYAAIFLALDGLLLLQGQRLKPVKGQPTPSAPPSSNAPGASMSG
jgi:hypothetical protein